MLMHGNIVHMRKSNNTCSWKFVAILTVLLLQLFSTNVYAAKIKPSLNCHEADYSFSSKSDTDDSISEKTSLKSIKHAQLCCDSSNCSTIACHASGAIVNSDSTLFLGIYLSSSQHRSASVSSLVKRHNSLFRPPILS